jgi:hypothetical protein
MNGNVGIGTTTPGPYTFNVAGKAISSGSKPMGGQLILTNDTNDNKIYLEAFSKDASDMPPAPINRAAWGNVPKISLRADQISMTARYQRDDEKRRPTDLLAEYLSLTARNTGAGR